IAGFPFLVPGHKARKLELKIKRTDEWYPPFAKDFGNVFNTVGTVKESLRALMRSDFDVITPHITN
ncbi:MAG: flagellar assembly protein FlaJ, partial [Candidatus Korarchaeota archaeon]|nr:flagellar assembly protein FlaJ [Candidatus Korarchaeota archaeon]